MRTVKELRDRVSMIQRKLGTIREFEQQYESIATSIKAVEIAPLRITSSDIELDVSLTIKEWKSDKISRYKAMKRLDNVLETAEKYAEYAGDGTASQRRTTLTADILAATRDSARFKGMADSATKGGNVDSEEDFFYMVVADAMNNLRGVDKQSLLTQLNSKLSDKGYSKVSRTTLKYYRR